MLRNFLPRSRTAIVATSVVGGLAVIGGGIATGTAISGATHPADAATPPSASTAKHAPKATASAPAQVVAAVTTTSVTVDTNRGVKTYALTGTTTYREGRSTVSLSAVQPGEKVRIRIAPGTASAPVAQSVVIAPAAPATPSTTA